MLLWLHSMGVLSGRASSVLYGFVAEDGLAGHMLYFFRQGRFSKLSGTSLGGKSKGRPELSSCVGVCPPQFEYID